MRMFEHINANTLDQAVAVLARGDALVNAGGTDLVGTMRVSVLSDNLYPKTVVNIKSISPSLDYIKKDGGVLKIGACTRLEDIAKSSIIHDGWKALGEAAHKTASPHIREAGTIGGNICQLNRCWYFRKRDNLFNCIRKGGNMCYAMAGDNRYHSIFGALNACVAVNPSDTAPALVVLDATIKTTKRNIPAEEFWGFAIPGSTVLEQDEIVTEIQIPEFSGNSSFVKFAVRKSIDFPIVNCAATLVDGNFKICLNAVYNKPYRVTAAEKAMEGKTINEANAEAAGEAAVANAFVLPAFKTNPGNKWMVQIAKTMVKKAILACA
jgi:xanthine dehydrogenase YagS FAD-binding subunit